MENEQIWHSWQSGVPIDGNDSVMVEARQSFKDAQTRSMSAGDIIEKNGELHMAVSIGFSRVDWGTAPDIDELLNK
jgi:hypothetical protein